ncbi:biotin--[acetyl-CoA-carboxylase] ligase [Priestia taiwanensis]|uniref:biotin--[acetyl-CoA-carboxylase] ligase n=1 Tax=Priestia taiwanensis TaxID=1347902 RepID=UPI00227C01FE|nr:biotin--[acetyl-CoA-carboxylase] ligase [Priestia taiwanensis]
MGSEIRTKLLQMFSEAKEGYVSGQAISNELGCSRTAVWKHIEELRKAGYEVEAVRRLGYKIIEKPDRVTANEIMLGLETEFIGRYVQYEESVDSTQKIAAQIAYEQAPEGTVVIAEEQRIGRGRMNRSWYSQKGKAVTMSLILRPKMPPQQAPQLTLLTAVSIVLALRDVTHVQADIKWPNDILMNGKKVVGILTELQAEADQINSVIIGMGINVNSVEEDFPEQVKDIATSLRIESGEKINRATLIQRIFFHMEKLYKQYLEHGFKPIKLLWESFALSVGKEITARTLSSTLKGKVLGITDEGVLQLEDNYGNVHLVYSADIEVNS